jgi:hypothetical protein
MLPQRIAQSDTTPHEVEVTSLILPFSLPLGSSTYKK